MKALCAIAAALALIACDGTAPNAVGPTPTRVVLGGKEIEARCERDVIWQGGSGYTDLTAAANACEGTLFISYSGPIDSETIEFVNALPENPPNVMFLYLNSGGGVVTDAMIVGRVLWERMVLAAVREGDQCLSACIFVLAGARVRGVEGRIGVHRMFTQDPTIDTPQDLRASSVEFETDAKNYLQEFGVSASVVDLMMSTPSDTMRYLSRDELYDFGLGEINVVHRELGRHAVIARCGAAFEQQVRAAELAATERCRPGEGYTGANFGEAMACREQVMQEYRVGDYPDGCS